MRTRKRSPARLSDSPHWGSSTGLSQICGRALYFKGRSVFRGSRQELRHAIQRFLRRHRRDPGALQLALRIAASGSLLALLGLAGPAAPARAEFPAQRVFVERDASNPLLEYSDLVNPHPAFVDLDGDGDLDLAVDARASFGFAIFDNTGTASAPAFVGRTDGSPFSPAAPCCAMAFADLDADGDLDAAVAGALRYFENTGNALEPAFVERSGAQNPLAAASGNAIVFADFDADGDLDLVLGESDGTLPYFENTGSPQQPAFLARTGTSNPLDAEDLGSSAVPAAGDIDADGDVDLVAGHDNGRLALLLNTGTPSAPAFVRINTGPASPFSSFDLGGYSAPALGDIDADGDLDVLAGDASNGLRYLENIGSASAMALVERSGAEHPLADAARGANPITSFADVDGDGDLDAALGSGGHLTYLENTGLPTHPHFVQRVGSGHALAGASSAEFPAFFDLDADGDPDLVSGNRYFENTGSPSFPAYLERSGAQNPAASLPNHAFVIADLDADGDADAFGAPDPGPSQARYFENTGTPSNAAFSERTGAAMPFAASAYAFAAADLNGDGRPDVSAGYRWLENVGGPGSPAFVTRSAEGNPMPVKLDWTRLAFADLDGDGRPELLARAPAPPGAPGPLNPLRFHHFALEPVAARLSLRPNLPAAISGLGVAANAVPTLASVGFEDQTLIVGDADGRFRGFWRSAFPPAFPQFSALTGIDDPFAGFDAGDRSAPLVANLTGEAGAVDLLAGNAVGNLRLWHKAPSDAFFSEQTGIDNPFETLNLGGNAALAIGPIGIGDLVLGHADGGISLLLLGESSPFFWFDYSHLVGEGNPLAGFDVGANSVPALGDLDQDGDLDVVVGAEDGTLTQLENVATNASPDFRLRGGSASRFAGIDVGSDSAPAFVQLDSDADLDLIVGNRAGAIAVLENLGDRFASPAEARNPLAPLATGWLAFGDLDADGDLDAIGGSGVRPSTFFKNTGTPQAPAYVERTGPSNPAAGLPESSLPPALADLDGDGDLDAVYKSGFGTTPYYENTGSPTQAHFALRVGSGNPTQGLGLSGAAAFGDLDGDADLDLICGVGVDGRFRYFENTGSAASAVFVERAGELSPLPPLDFANSLIGGPPAVSMLADVDRDGDLDLLALVGTTYVYLENSGAPTAPAFRPGANPLHGFATAGTLADVDVDGDLDFFGIGRFAENVSPHSMPLPHWAALASLAALAASGWRTLRTRVERWARSD